MSAATLLDRLDKVKQTGPGRWIARCPAHEDRGPSLSIRELEDGRILLHDFGGCGAVHVVTSLGLTMSDLFPKALGHHFAPSRSRIPAADLLQLISFESMAIAVLAGDFLKRRTLTDADWERLEVAARRIGTARDHVNGR